MKQWDQVANWSQFTKQLLHQYNSEIKYQCFRYKALSLQSKYGLWRYQSVALFVNRNLNLKYIYLEFVYDFHYVKLNVSLKAKE